MYDKDNATPAGHCRSVVKIKFTFSRRQYNLGIPALSRHAQKARATLGKDDCPAVAPRRAAAGKRRGHTADDSRSAPRNGGPHQQTILVPTEVGTVWGPEGTGEIFSG